MDFALTPIFIPQLNPNENEALLARLHVKNGQHVDKDEVLCTLETTKATAEVGAEVEGYIVGIRYSEGDIVRTGQILCYIADSPDSPIPIPESAAPLVKEEAEVESIMHDLTTESDRLPQGLRITRPALKVALIHGIDLNQLPKGPLITEELLQKQFNIVSPKEISHTHLNHFNPTAIVIYGGGGHGKSLIELIRSLKIYRIIGILDDGIQSSRTNDQPSTIMGLPILGGGERLVELYEQGIRLAVNAIGGIGDIQVRVKIFERLAQHGFACPSLIHPNAYVEPSASLAAGVQVFPHAYIGSETSIGFGAIINTGAIVSHECHIGDYVNLSPGTILAGQVEIGDKVLIGMGVTVNLGVKIGSGARIGNNATIKADVPPNSIIKAGMIHPS